MSADEPGSVHHQAHSGWHGEPGPETRLGVPSRSQREAASSGRVGAQEASRSESSPAGEAEPEPASAPETATVSEAAAAHRLADGFSAFERELAGWIVSHAFFVALLVACALFQHSAGADMRLPGTSAHAADSTTDTGMHAALAWFLMSSVALVRSNRVVRAQAGRKADPQLLRLHLITFVLVLVAGEQAVLLCLCQLAELA